MNDKLVLIVVNVDHFFLSHRYPLAQAARQQGYRVVVICGDTGLIPKIEALGFEVGVLPSSRSFSTAWLELQILYKLWAFYRHYKPALIHHVTLKMILLGSIAAYFANSRVSINAVTGLGYLFTDGRESKSKKLTLHLLRLFLKGKGRYVLFQNEEDEAIFTKAAIGESKNYRIIRGSGVNVNKFAYVPAEMNKPRLDVILTARLMKDKGILEFIEVAKILEPNFRSKLRFKLIGFLDGDNPTAISKTQLEALLDPDYLVWEGYSDNIYAELLAADIILFPSYREGLPKSLLEACAVGRPIVCFDVTGCRDVVRNGVNGFLVPFGNTNLLAEQVILLANKPEMRLKMGAAGRKIVEDEYAEELILKQTLSLYTEVLQPKFKN